MSVLDDLQSVTVPTVFSDLSGALRPASAVCYLLRRGQHTSKFEVIKQLTSAFWMEFDEMREAARLICTSTDDDFADDYSLSTHIAYGTPVDGETDVYELAQEPFRDYLEPNGANPFWKLSVTKILHERFTIPEDDTP